MAGYTAYFSCRNLLIKVDNNFPFPVKKNVPLSRLSSFAIGGLAKNYIPVTSRMELIRIINFLWKNNLPFNIFAGGSNIVFPDTGLNHILIHLINGQLHLDNKNIISDAGVPLSRVI